MELTSVTAALLAVIKVFKRFCYFEDQSYYLILALIVLLSYCFRFFDTVPYLLLVGPKDTGKTLVLDYAREYGGYVIYQIINDKGAKDTPLGDQRYSATDLVERMRFALRWLEQKETNKN